MAARHYALVFIAVTALLAGGVAAFNLAVDPYGVLGTGWLSPPVTPLTNHRVRVVRAYSANATAPNVLVFGSSRAMAGIRAEDVGQLIPGARTQVFAYPAGTIQDHLAVLRWLTGPAISRARPLEVAILLLDADIFGRGVPATALDLRQHPAVSGEDRLHFYLAYLLAVPSRAALRIVSEGIGLPTPFRATETVPAGAQRAAAAEAEAEAEAEASPPAAPTGLVAARQEVAQGTAAPAATVARALDRHLPQGAEFERAIMRLREFVRLCDTAGIRLVVLMSPLRAAYVADLGPEQVDAVVARVRQVTPVWTFDEAGQPDMDQYWVDPSHFTPELGRLMTARALGRPMPSDGRRLGRRLDPQAR